MYPTCKLEQQLLIYVKIGVNWRKSPNLAYFGPKTRSLEGWNVHDMRKMDKDVEISIKYN